MPGYEKGQKLAIHGLAVCTSDLVLGCECLAAIIVMSATLAYHMNWMIYSVLNKYIYLFTES
jgi:hypothetical protein